MKTSGARICWMEATLENNSAIANSQLSLPTRLPGTGLPAPIRGVGFRWLAMIIADSTGANIQGSVHGIAQIPG
ncbi:MAG: hypothetical protein ACREA9_18195 [Pyrinomonadaceae bacterium]